MRSLLIEHRSGHNIRSPALVALEWGLLLQYGSHLIVPDWQQLAAPVLWRQILARFFETRLMAVPASIGTECIRSQSTLVK
jgi:hypothetical protein